MAKPICADYQTPFLLPPALEDWIPADHPARFIREFVNQLPWAELGFKAPSAEGRPSYSAQMLLGLWLFAFLNKIRSSRALERACREQISLLWLSGMNAPDHNTLWRFWRENKGALENVFKQSVQLATRTGLVGLTLQAVDGTKIQAACSGRTAWTKEHMEALERAVEAEMQLTENALKDEGKDPAAPGYRLTPELSQPAQLKEKIRAGLAQLKESKREHYHPHEPEARRMPCEGRNRFGYNAQAVVDDHAGIITAAAVTNAENDNGLLVPILQQAQENTGARAEENVADSAYGTGVDLLASEAHCFCVTTAIQSRGGEDSPYHHNKFIYDAEKQTVHCPRGEPLDRVRTRAGAGQNVQIFRCRHQHCPVKHLCTRDPKGRQVEIRASHDLVRKMRAKLATERGRYALKRRRETVEPVFARIKEHMGFRRWTARGLKNAQAQWAMLCLTVNLQVLMKQKPSERPNQETWLWKKSRVLPISNPLTFHAPKPPRLPASLRETFGHPWINVLRQSLLPSFRLYDATPSSAGASPHPTRLLAARGFPVGQSFPR
jgi:transposase